MFNNNNKQARECVGLRNRFIFNLIKEMLGLNRELTSKRDHSTTVKYSKKNSEKGNYSSNKNYRIKASFLIKEGL